MEGRKLIVALPHQWDESRQYTRELRTPDAPSVRQGRLRLACAVMMQSGSIVTGCFEPDDRFEIAVEPWFSPPSLIFGQDTVALLGCLEQRMAFNVQNPDSRSMKLLGSAADAILHMPEFDSAPANLGAVTVTKSMVRRQPPLRWPVWSPSFSTCASTCRGKLIGRTWSRRLTL